jgi:TonB family protein
MSCTIYFQIDTDGRLIGEPVIERSSGTSAFDQSALMAIRRVGVFPAFPPGFEYEFIGLHLDFEYVP